MPSRPAQAGAVRIFGVVALVAAVVTVALLVLRGTGSNYELKVVLDNASQLVKGNQVKVGGNPVGTVKRIELDDHNRAVVTITVKEESLTPMHRGTKAVIRSSSSRSQSMRDSGPTFGVAWLSNSV